MRQILVLLFSLVLLGVGCSLPVATNKIVNQPEVEPSVAEVGKNEPSAALLEKYKNKRLDVLNLRKATTTKDFCSSMTDTINLTLKSIEIKADNSWVITVQKSGSRVTIDPGNGKKYSEKLPTETWTMSSSDIYNADCLVTGCAKGNKGIGAMPVGSDVIHPIFVSPQKVIFERIRLSC